MNCSTGSSQLHAQSPVSVQNLPFCEDQLQLQAFCEYTVDAMATEASESQAVTAQLQVQAAEGLLQQKASALEAGVVATFLE